jgi:hypothetical protein
MRPDEQHWLDMLRRWRTANEKRDINSVLVSVDFCFVQLLEGERTMAEAVYKLIAQDKRHFQIRQLSAQTVSHPTFDGLSLCHSSLSSDARTLLDNASIDAEMAKELLVGSLNQWRNTRPRAIFASRDRFIDNIPVGRRPTALS